MGADAGAGTRVRAGRAAGTEARARELGLLTEGLMGCGFTSVGRFFSSVSCMTRWLAIMTHICSF